jgi:hypothetical protein
MNCLDLAYDRICKHRSKHRRRTELASKSPCFRLPVSIQCGHMALPQEIVSGLTTKADKIRALSAAGLARADIARFLGISYQHVRNTLVQGRPASRITTDTVSGTPAPTHSPMERLIEAGFQILAECSPAADGGFAYSAKAPTDAGVYAFAVQGLVMYVGLTRSGLRTRLGHYVYGHPGQKTSSRVKLLILKALSEGHRVQVLIAQPTNFQWNGLPVDGASGLETGLIRMLKPAWNQQGSR